MANAMVLLQSLAANNDATLDLTSWYSSTYESYVIELINVLPATDGVALYSRLSVDGGANWDAGNNYAFIFKYFNAGGTGGTASNSATSIFPCGVDQQYGNATYGGVCGILGLTNPASTSGYKYFNGTLTGWDNRDAFPTGFISQYIYKPANAVNGLRFYFSSGNVASGTIKVYGMTK